MSNILHYMPGMEVTIFLETKVVDGYRTNSPTLPVVNRIIFPALTLASGYPSPMTKLDTGLYYAQFTLPTGAVSIGSYLVDIAYTNPTTNVINNQIYQVVVTAPFGNFATSLS